MENVFLISAGQLRTRKGGNISNQKNMYLNYGLLSLATVLNLQGYKPVVFHGNFTPPEKFLQQLIDYGLLKTAYPVYISIPSYYALSWVSEFTRLIKTELEHKIIVGGRWVIDDDSASLQAELPYVDEIIEGNGENKILRTLTGTDDTSDYSHLILNYELLKDRQRYQPSIEISRGCGKKCAFCQERNEPLGQLKPPEVILNEYKNLVLEDGLRTITPYFEASLFKPTREWLADFIMLRDKYQLNFLWRAESRVDALPEEIVHLMAKAGMGVIDLGLESASLQQLINMNKSPRPESYLERASSLLRECYRCGIKTKVNIMFYAGENSSTIAETRSWLNAHRQYIYGVSCGVVAAFGWDHRKRNFVEELCRLGASVCAEESFVGVTNFHLSNTLTYQQGVEEAKKLSREFMPMSHFFDLKAFSYYPRDYTLEQFQQDIKNEQGSYSFDY